MQHPQMCDRCAGAVDASRIRGSLRHVLRRVSCRHRVARSSSAVSSSSALPATSRNVTRARRTSLLNGLGVRDYELGVRG